MTTNNETARIADAINALRPDWPVNSLKTFISKNLADKPYRDVAVALAWIACDPVTSTPARVLEPGPWWNATLERGSTPAVATYCPEHHTKMRAGECVECRDGSVFVGKPANFRDTYQAALEQARADDEWVPS